MTDQMDNRLRELVGRLAAAAPEAPPFPRVAERAPATSRARGWVLAAAGAAVVLAIIGLPFLLFSGGGTSDVATTVPTPTTIAPPPAETTTTTVPAVDSCTPGGLLVRTLGQEGAAGHLVTPVRFTNVSGGPCELADPVTVTGIGTGGEEVAAAPGTSLSVEPDAGALIAAGEARVMLLEVGTACGTATGPPAASVRITLSTGDVSVPFDGDLGCNFAYSGFGAWPEAEPPTPDELTIAEDLTAFALDPTADRFAALQFADTVWLTLGPDIARSQSGDGLADPAAWVFGEEADGFRARTAPFSALDVLAEGRPVEVTAGPHDHCASPPVPVFETVAGLRQISIQPSDATSCLEWWVVDVFLSATGEVAGVTLDLYEP